MIKTKYNNTNVINNIYLFIYSIDPILTHNIRAEGVHLDIDDVDVYVEVEMKMGTMAQDKCDKM
jgi:hypothetical protein